MYKILDCWIIDLHTEFKNYDNEIEKFINWITPFVTGRKKRECVGWWKSESMDEKENIYIERLCNNQVWLSGILT